MKAEVTSSLKYNVEVNDVKVSSHVQEREAIERAVNECFAAPSAKVEVEVTGKHTVKVTGGVTPVPVPAPLPSPQPATESLAGTSVPPAPNIKDGAGAAWSLGASSPGGLQLLKNGVHHGGGGGVLLYYKKPDVYTKNSANEWYKATATSWVISTDPTATVPPIVVPPIASGGLVFIGDFPTPTLTDPHVGRTARLRFGKHTTWRIGLNGDAYSFGGDGTAHHIPGNSSGAMPTVGRYEVAARKYTEDFLYQGVAGEPCPRGLDFVQSVWAKNLFWLCAGYTQEHAIDYLFAGALLSRSNNWTYDPITKKFADRGARIADATYHEGCAGSYVPSRDSIYWVQPGNDIRAINLSTLTGGRQFDGGGNTGNPEKFDQAYDEAKDELLYLAASRGTVEAVNLATQARRVIATLIPFNASGVQGSIPFVFAPEYRKVIVFYRTLDDAVAPLKVVDIDTGAVSSHVYPQGIQQPNQAFWHPGTKELVATGEVEGTRSDGDFVGAYFYHWKFGAAPVIANAKSNVIVTK